MVNVYAVLLLLFIHVDAFYSPGKPSGRVHSSQAVVLSDTSPLKSMDLSSLKDLMSSIEIPDLKSVDLPDFKPMDLPQLSGIEAPVPVIAAAAVILLAAVASSSNKTQSRKKSTTNSLSIPYDAAARWAYDLWLAENDEATFDDAAYAAFKDMYEREAIAEATAKKLARDRASFANKAPALIPERKITPKKTTKKAPPFFFAKEK